MLSSLYPQQGRFQGLSKAWAGESLPFHNTLKRQAPSQHALPRVTRSLAWLVPSSEKHEQ